MSAPAAEEKSSAKVVSSELTDALSAVKTHVEKEHRATFRESGGLLRHPYLVPAGAHYTRQIWDWDSVHEGVGLLPYGGAPYMKGSMLNFLDHVRRRDNSSVIPFIRYSKQPLAPNVARDRFSFERVADGRRNGPSPRLHYSGNR